MATLYQRNGQYYVNYSLNGKRVRRSVGSKREGEIYLEELKYRLFKGDIKPSKPEIPLDYFFTMYLNNCKIRLSRRGYERYRASLDHFIIFFTNQCPIKYLSQVSRGSIQDYIQYRQKKKPKPKANTINLELTVIRAALNYALDREWIDKNPASRMKMLKTTDSKKGKALSEAEVDKLLDGCDDPWFKDILLVLLNTGMRAGELRNLIWSDLNWEQDIIKIQAKEFWTPKSYSRDIPMNKMVKDVLVKLKTNSRGTFIFNLDGKQIGPNKLRQMLIKLARKVGLDISRIHSLRHTFCSNLINKNIDLPTVQKLMGHSDIKTTMIYSHQSEDHIREAINLL